MAARQPIVWLVTAALAACSAVFAFGPTALIQAVRQQDKPAIRALLQQGVDVNAAQSDGATALHWAAYLDDVETADLLIRAGARLDAFNDYGVAPIALACGHAKTALVGRLLEAGANPNAASTTGETPLMVCARTGNVEGTRALVARSADVNAKETWQQQTPLMMAAALGQVAVQRMLLQGGADVAARSKSGFTALHFAARTGIVDAGQALVASGAEVNARASDGSTPLHVATVRGQVDFTLWLLDRGADPNAAGSGYTPLHWVAGSWHTELTGPNGIAAEREEEWQLMGGLTSEQKMKLAKALLARGANPNARLTRTPPQFGYSSARFKVGMSGATPFLLAAMDGNTTLMSLLAAHGGDPLLTTTENTTPLMVAAGIGRVPAESHVTPTATMAAVRLALELGGDIRAINKEGNTALHGAAHIRLDELVQFLVDRGADVNARNARGLTPLQVAEGAGHSDNPGLVGGATATLLRKLGAN